MTPQRILFILAIALIVLCFALGAYGYLFPGALPDWLRKLLVSPGSLIAGIEAVLRVFFGKSLLELWRATAPRPSGPCQAPRSLDEFVGRRGEIRRLTKALKPGGRVAITGVVGMRGIGKNVSYRCNRVRRLKCVRGISLCLG